MIVPNVVIPRAVVVGEGSHVVVHLVDGLWIVVLLY